MLDVIESHQDHVHRDLVIVRFGHAAHATPEQFRRIKDLGIIIEANIGSNDITNVMPKEDHPILQMLYEQNEVILNTDGGGVMKTDLDEEYGTVKDKLAKFKNPNPPPDEKPLTVKVKGVDTLYKDLSAEEQQRFDLAHLQKASSRYYERIQADNESRRQPKEETP